MKYVERYVVRIMPIPTVLFRRLSESGAPWFALKRKSSRLMINFKFVGQLQDATCKLTPKKMRIRGVGSR